MKHTRKITASVVAALGLGLSGPLFADAEDNPAGFAANGVESSAPAEATSAPTAPFYGAPSDTAADSAAESTAAIGNSAYGADPDAATAAYDADTVPIMTVVTAQPSLVFSDGEWYSLSGGQWFALIDGDWYAMDDAAYAIEEPAADATSGTIELYSMDGAEWYSFDDGEWRVWVPVVMLSEAPSYDVYLR
jgi:hypothetical protein